MRGGSYTFAALIWLAVAQNALASAASAQSPQLPVPTADPLQIDFASDPILRLADSSVPVEQFRAAIEGAVTHHPGRLEAQASEAEAEAALDEARERLYPSGDLTFTSYKSIARDFSNDPLNLLERARPEQRTDLLVNLEQTVFDFGATSRRIAAAGARLRAASADQESVADELALRAIASWYDVFANQALVAISVEFSRMQESFRDAMRQRIQQGVSAEGDLARVESYIASADTRLAQLQRSLAQAEARYEELVGTSPAPVQERAPQLGVEPTSKDEAVIDAGSHSLVRAAEAEAEAARLDYRAAQSESLPRVTAGLEGGRYGVFENDRDYDVRARVTLRHRFFGGIEPRVAQVGARARAVEARAERVRQEAERDASIAWSDVQALEAQLVAVRESYMASRRSRDVLLERFIMARGSLFDVLDANDRYFNAAVVLVQAISELDAARYVLLSRTGKLLPALAIDPAPIVGAG